MRCVEQMKGGEVFVPKIPSMKVIELAKAVAPDADITIIGIRPGEKLHEVLISEDEARSTLEREDMFVVRPTVTLWQRNMTFEGKELPDGFRYSSDNNPEWLNLDQIKEIIAPIETAYLEGRLR
jgi:UDP-N-acetylglucosamine 4,6-dehydratase